MKILVFEYITGGGFNQEDLPESLANEGRLMVQALIDSLSAIGGLELTVMLDWRMTGSVNLHGSDAVVITREDDCYRQFETLGGQADAVWPVAPESGGILQALCQAVEKTGKRLLTSPSSAVVQTGDKYMAYQCLSEHGIATVPSRLLGMSPIDFYPGENIVKPVDGIGCEDSYVVSSLEDRDALPMRIGGKGRYIVQPHLHGKKTSLSCLFKEGRGWLLCVNLQKFRLIDNQYRLMHIIVNFPADGGAYQEVASQVAGAFPDLWGYAGIDLIETPDGILVLEINPRLTTSFAGIENALGINLASLVLQLLEGDPLIQAANNRAITLTVAQDTYESA